MEQKMRSEKSQSQIATESWKKITSDCKGREKGKPATQAFVLYSYVLQAVLWIRIRPDPNLLVGIRNESEIKLLR